MQNSVDSACESDELREEIVADEEAEEVHKLTQLAKLLRERENPCTPVKRVFGTIENTTDDDDYDKPGPSTRQIRPRKKTRKMIIEPTFV